MATDVGVGAIAAGVVRGTTADIEGGGPGILFDVVIEPGMRGCRTPKTEGTGAVVAVPGSEVPGAGVGASGVGDGFCIAGTVGLNIGGASD